MELIDLSNELYDGQVSHFRVSVREYLSHKDTAARVDPPAPGYATRVLMMCDHTGTHVDAPYHFYPERRTIDKMPLDSFYGNAVALDFSNDQANGGALGLRRFQEVLAEAPVPLRRGDALLLKLMRGEEDVYCGLDDELSASLGERAIKLLGVDRPTPDCPMNKRRPAHMHLLGRDIIIVEGLANLDRVCGRSFIFLALPLKIVDGTGSPVRAAGLLLD